MIIYSYKEKAILFIIGDKLSSNAKEIKNHVINKYKNIETYIEDNITNIQNYNLKNKDIFLINATSTSENKVNDIKKRLKNLFLHIN